MATQLAPDHLARISRDGEQHLQRIADLASTSSRLRRERDSLRQELVVAIREGRESGHTLEELGRAASMTRQGVHHLLNKEEK